MQVRWTRYVRPLPLATAYRTRQASRLVPTALAQDRISSTGELLRSAGTPPPPPYVIGTPTAGLTAPEAPPVGQAALETLVGLVSDARGGVLVLTGAGCSTESNIPDYRSPTGAYSTGFKPMTHQQFMASDANRSRYWARSFAGWHHFSRVEPNAAHEALARLQRRGWLAAPLITQNVDRLHHRALEAAGTPSAATPEHVLELHGTTHQVVCTDCGRLSCRQEFQRQLADLNPEAAAQAAQIAAAADEADEAARMVRAGTAAPLGSTLRELPVSGLAPERRARGGAAGPRVQRPDGDAEVAPHTPAFCVPACCRCGGVLKPDVVFFGDAIPKPRAGRALQLASSCDAMLVVGSSLTVYSAFRLAKAAKEGGARLAIITVGPTRADELADVKVEARAGEVLARLATASELALPPAG